MNWPKGLIRKLLGRDRDRFHDQAQQVTTRSLRSELLRRRTDRMVTQGYLRELDAADYHFDRRKQRQAHYPERRGQHG